MSNSKKSVSFEEDDDSLKNASASDDSSANKRFKEKHSLDSDEEDDNAKYDVLAEDDIEGQEEATIDFDEEIQITPFNMREEMEEGHFDSDGTYIFDKTKEIHDSWIDNIDWVKVQHSKRVDTETKKRPFAYGDDSDDDSDSDDGKKPSDIELYEEILSILEEGETPAKAIRRLAKNKSKIPSASQRWKNKKLKASGKGEGNVDQEAVDKAVEEQKQMLRLTELCDSLVQKGIMDIYESSYERLTFSLKHTKEKNKASRLTIAEGMKDDDALDMFADDFDSKEAEKKKVDTSGTSDKVIFKEPEVPKQTSSSSSTTEKGGGDSDDVLWEYKTENTDTAEVKGPFTTSQMIKWADDGTLGTGVFCRRINTNSQFYNSARIDFELYE